MIGTLQVELAAKNPNLPLHPLRAYLNSPSSLRISNVPKRVGQWNITSVQLVAAYPDGQIKTADCVLTGGLWVGTIEGSTSTGTSENGYTIYASGIDENGNPVSNYILGKGTIEILDTDGTITPSVTVSYVHMLSAQPDNPKEGDLYPLSGEYYIWQNGAAHAIGDDSGAIDELKAQLQNKRDKTDFSVQGRPEGEGSWFVFNSSKFEWNGEAWTDGSGISIFKNTTQPEEQPYIMTDTEESVYFDVDEDGNGTVRWNGQTQTIVGFIDQLAMKSEIPTKTSVLSNDSGFITSAQIPTSYDKIQDSNNNVINANRTVSYIGEVSYWTDYMLYPDQPLTWDAENDWWRVDVSPSLWLQLQFDSGTWTLIEGENIGGEWVETSDSVQDSEQATSLEFIVGGKAYSLSKGVQQQQISGELVLKSYVDGLIGDINSVLDAINGEVI